MASIQCMSVEHGEKGRGIVVDRLSHFREDTGEFIVLLGVAFHAHPKPAIHYHDPDELEQLEVLDFPSDDYEDEDGEDGDEASGEEEEEEVE